MKYRDIRKGRLFALGYSDNTSTSYLLDYMTRHGVIIDGVIFPRNQLKLSWKRLVKKIQVRGFVQAIARIFENRIIRKNQISEICEKHIEKVFFVDEINSDELREILVANRVEVLLLTATPIIKPIIIDIDGLTILNAHTGWLPKYRGLDANLKALKDGHHPGVSVHRVTKEIDAGEVYLRKEFEIDYDGDLLRQIDQKELELAGKLFVEAIDLRRKHMLKPIVTSEQLGQYEPPLAKKEKKRIIQELKQRGS